MPPRNWLLMSLPFKEFLASDHLRILAIPNLEPCGLPPIVRRSPVFRDNALQVQLASLVEEGSSTLFYVLGVNDRRQSPDGASQLMFAIQQSLGFLYNE